MNPHSAYRVLSADSLNQLEIDVNEAIGKGWQCVGSAVPTTYGIHTYIQTMVKPAEIKNELSVSYERVDVDERVVVDGDTVKLVRDGGGA